MAFNNDFRLFLAFTKASSINNIDRKTNPKSGNNVSSNNNCNSKSTPFIKAILALDSAIKRL